AGRVFLPDGVTPVGKDVKVVLTAGRSPPLDVLTGDDGRFSFPLAPVGGFSVIADTGTPAVDIAARTGTEIVTNAFQDAAGKPLLDVRLFGKATGELQPQGKVAVDVRLQGAGAVLARVEREDGTPVQGASVTLRTSSDVDADVEGGFADQATDSA